MHLLDTFKGSDGKYSSRKLTAFLHIILMAITTAVFWVKTADGITYIYCMLLHGLFALLLLGIITIDNIIHFRHGK